jgi:hypothetical protein
MQSSTPILTARLIRRNCFNLRSQLAVRIVSQLQWTRRAAIEPSNSRRNGALLPIVSIGRIPGVYATSTIERSQFKRQTLSSVRRIRSRPSRRPFPPTRRKWESLKQVKSRILDSIQYLVRNGVLIASDFTPYPPASVRQTLAKSDPEKNACAKQ